MLASIGCRRSNKDAAESPPDSKPAVTDTPETYSGTVELVNKTELEGIKCIALANEGNSILVSDGTIIAEQGIDLEVLSPVDLKRTASFTITDSMSGGYPWSTNSMAISSNGSMVLLYNQYIELSPPRAAVALDIQPVIGRPNVRPGSWSISPNGKLALVCVGSYWSSDESTLSTFDLEIGKAVAKIATGRNMEHGCACFLNNETIASVTSDGTLSLHNINDASTETIPEKLSQGSIQDGRNLRLQPFHGGKKLLVTGADEIFMVDVEQRKILFRNQIGNGNGIVLKDGKHLIWQDARINLREKETDYLLMVANVETGKILGEYQMPTFYQMILLDDSSEFIYAAHYNELHKLRIDLGPITNKQP